MKTWFNSSVTNAEVECVGYKLFRLDRLHKPGGGICVYIRNSIKGTLLKDLTKIYISGLHQLWVQLQHRNTKSVLICVAYRPPDCSLGCFNDDFMPTYTNALILCKPIVVLGDLNCNLLKTGLDHDALDELCSSLNLCQVIAEPTRVTQSSTSVIDVIITSNKDLVIESGVTKTCISDHFLVYCVLNVKVPKPPSFYIHVRSYKNYDPSLFSASVFQALFDNVVHTVDVNGKVAAFNDMFLESKWQSTVPFNGDSEYYITDSILKAMNQKEVTGLVLSKAFNSLCHKILLCKHASVGYLQVHSIGSEVTCPAEGRQYVLELVYQMCYL